jgi:phage FluMu protein Com
MKPINIDNDQELEKPMRELRCPKCHRLLMREFIVKGRLQIPCWGKDCKEMCTFTFRDYRNAKMKTGESQI